MLALGRTVAYPRSPRVEKHVSETFQPLQNDFPSAMATRALRVLIVDDNRHVGSALLRMLRREAPDWDGEVVDEPHAGVDAILQNRHDAALIDWHFNAEVTGLQVCRKVRGMGSAMPLAMWTVQGDVSQRVEALDAGADEFFVKDSISAQELCSRVRVMVLRAAERRRRALATTERAVAVGPLVVDFASQSAFVGGRLVELGRHQRRLLLCLGRMLDSVVSHQELCECSGILPDPTFRNLQNEVWRLRERLGPVAGPLVRSVRGKGYILGELRRHKRAAMRAGHNQR